HPIPVVVGRDRASFPSPTAIYRPAAEATCRWVREPACRDTASGNLGCHFGRQDEAGAVHPATHSGDPTGQPSLIVARRHVAAEVGASQPMDVFTDAETTPTSSRPPVGSSSRQLACLPLGSPTHLHASPTAGLRVPRRAAEAARSAADGGPTSSTHRPGRHHSSQPTSTFEPA